MHKGICIIEFPSNLGLKAPAPGKEPGVNKLPAWLRHHGFHDLLEPQQIYCLAPPPYGMELDEASGVRNVGKIITYAQQQANLIARLLPEYSFLIILGGDCSITIGNALGLKQAGNFGLFYLDGHTDFMEPDLSETGGAGGMAAAIVAGHGPEKLTNINGQFPYVNEEYVWCVGNREYDNEYENVIRSSRARYISLLSLREKGIVSGVKAFLEMVDIHRLTGFWVHIDVDVLDDAVMPAVDSRTPGGLTYAEFNLLVSLLLASPKATGIDITILDPDLDPAGQYTKEFVQNFVLAFKQARHSFL